MRISRHSASRRGSALLAVLWLAAALSAIAFSVAVSVRSETERTSTDVDGMRSYYLATGAIERALLWLYWGPKYRNPDGSPRYYTAGMPVMRFGFPSGAADVEIIPETSKLNINKVSPEQLMRLMAVLAVPADRAQMIVTGILDWRAPSPAGFTDFDQYYLSLSPTFRSRHASFQEIEELLLIRGMTPELFYGRYDKAPDGRLLPRPGLRDCLSVYGGSSVFDANTVQPAVMQALGLPPEVAAQVVAMRPFLNPQQITDIPGATMAHIGIGSSAVCTLRATAAVRLPNGGYSDARRTVSAVVAFLKNQTNPPYHVLRWYDNAVAVR